MTYMCRFQRLDGYFYLMKKLIRNGFLSNVVGYISDHMFLETCHSPFAVELMPGLSTKKTY